MTCYLLGNAGIMGVCVCKGWVGVHLFDSPSAGQGLVDGSRGQGFCFVLGVWMGIDSFGLDKTWGVT